MQKSTLVLDNFDLFAITIVHRYTQDKKKCGVGDITNGFYGKIENKRDLQKKYAFVLKRMNIMIRHNIITIEIGERKKKYYKINHKNLVLKRCTFPDCVKDAVYIRDIEKRWICFQV